VSSLFVSVPAPFAEMGPDFSLLVSTAGIIIAVRIPFVKNYFPQRRKYFLMAGL
jgi:hypothetical protein